MHLLFTLLTVLALSGGAFYYQEDLTAAYDEVVYFSFCEEPVGFHISSIDPKFNANKEVVVEESKKAAEIWNDYYRTDLFEYDENSQLTLSLVFDERQRQINRINNQEQGLEVEKLQLGQDVEDYQENFETIERALDELNNQIEYWNDRGGAPTKIYVDLLAKQKELNDQIDTLNNIADTLNIATKEVNSKIDLLNQSIGAFNDLLDTLPEEGVFMPQENKIEIYFYDSSDRYVHTVAHELGHALGLSHVPEETALMHPTTSSNLELTEDDTAELLSFCQEQSKLDFIMNNLELVWENLKKEIKLRS